jgi:SAM-dependent methyltransferase
MRGRAGGGTGPSTRRLLAAGAEVIGFDLSPRMIELARRRTPGAGFHALDAAGECGVMALGTGRRRLWTAGRGTLTDAPEPSEHDIDEDRFAASADRPGAVQGARRERRLAAR